MKRNSLIILGVVLLLGAAVVYAVPSDPAPPRVLTESPGERFNISQYASQSVEAEAGNVTRLTFNVTTPTQTWQGYYGNITGTITLDDANNWTMYDWYAAEPQGEIYAANSSSVAWSNIKCLNYSANASELNLSVLESMYGLAPDDYDGVDETFDVNGLLSDGVTSHSTIYVGTYTIPAGTCPATDTYESDSSAGTNFQEILLTDTSNIVFATIIGVMLGDTMPDIWTILGIILVIFSGILVSMPTSKGK